MPVEERHGEANTRREGRPVQRRSLGSPSRDRANRRTPRTAPWLLGSHMPTWPGRCESRLTSYDVAQRWAHKPVSYTHLRAHETDSYLVCRLLLEKKKKNL